MWPDGVVVSAPGFDQDPSFGRAATNRLAALLNVGRIELHPKGLDRYRRTLVSVTRSWRSTSQRRACPALGRQEGLVLARSLGAHDGSNTGAPSGNRNAWNHGGRSAGLTARQLRAMARMAQDGGFSLDALAKRARPVD